MFVVAHISDLHFNGTEVHRRRIEWSLDYINDRADGIDALLVTGDITDGGSAAEYAEAARALTSPLPMLITAGNHDQRRTFNVALRQQDTDEPANTAKIIGDVLLLAVDTSIPGRNEGLLSDDTLAWMSSEIDAAGGHTPVLVAFHHPPATLGMPVMDTIRQTGEDRLADLVTRHPNIVGFVCGHAHTPAVTTFAGRQLSVAPGVASMLNLPFEGTDVLNPGQPPGIAFHIVDGDRLITHFRPVLTP